MPVNEKYKANDIAVLWSCRIRVNKIITVISVYSRVLKIMGLLNKFERKTFFIIYLFFQIYKCKRCYKITTQHVSRLKIAYVKKTLYEYRKNFYFYFLFEDSHTDE